jgi:tRNA dimethylallyltransferase
VSTLPKVLVLAGPTASGKTALSLSLAEALGGEVISADSVQVYTGLDVGSAKLPPGERRGVRHHLLDVVPPSVEFSVGDWLDAALLAIEDCVARGRTPLVVGGAGFYLRWLTSGRPPTPRSQEHTAAAARAALLQAADKAQKEALAASAERGEPGPSDEEVERLRWDAALRVLVDAGDPGSAARLARNDWYRAERVLEIVSASNRPVASFQADASGVSSLYQFRCFHLAVPRMQLYRRIDARCEAMLASGLLQEAAALWAAGARPGEDGATATPAGRSIGYAEALEVLAAAAATGGDAAACTAALEACLGDMQRASRNYAKRQHTWFRGEPHWRWVDTGGGHDACLADILASFRADEHVPCHAAADEAIVADAAGAGVEAARGEGEPLPAKVVKARNRALMRYTPQQRGAHLDADTMQRLCAWLAHWAEQQEDLGCNPARAARSATVR